MPRQCVKEIKLPLYNYAPNMLIALLLSKQEVIYFSGFALFVFSNKNALKFVVKTIGEQGYDAKGFRVRFVSLPELEVRIGLFLFKLYSKNSNY
jgi:hypothetical protein